MGPRRGLRLHRVTEQISHELIVLIRNGREILRNGLLRAWIWRKFAGNHPSSGRTRRDAARLSHWGLSSRRLLNRIRLGLRRRHRLNREV